EYALKSRSQEVRKSVSVNYVCCARRRSVSVFSILILPPARGAGQATRGAGQATRGADA
ncbi:hypothetical protein A2U01_0103926, partial [Trifolium medium]|nr:hypothetical protein [Trifolium medium]